MYSTVLVNAAHFSTANNNYFDSWMLYLSLLCLNKITRYTQAKWTDSCKGMSMGLRNNGQCMNMFRSLDDCWKASPQPCTGVLRVLEEGSIILTPFITAGFDLFLSRFKLCFIWNVNDVTITVTRCMLHTVHEQGCHVSVLHV